METRTVPIRVEGRCSPLFYRTTVQTQPVIEDKIDLKKIKKRRITRAFNGHLKRKNAQHNNQLRQTNAISGASNNETNFIIGATDKKFIQTKRNRG